MGWAAEICAAAQTAHTLTSTVVARSLSNLRSLSDTLARHIIPRSSSRSPPPSEAFSSVGHNSVMFQLPQFQPGSQGQYAAQLQQVVKDNSTEEIDKWIPSLNKATESHDAADQSMLKKTAAEIRQWASETANNAAETFRRLTASKPTAQPPASNSEWLKNLPTVQESIKSPPQETATKSEPPPGTDFNPDSPMTGFDQQTIVTHPQTGLSESAINWCKAHTPWLCR